MSHCSGLADGLCASANAGQNVSKALTAAVEVFFRLLEDTETDVRNMADESVNRVIVALSETHAGRLQVSKADALSA